VLAGLVLSVGRNEADAVSLVLEHSEGLPPAVLALILRGWQQGSVENDCTTVCERVREATEWRTVSGRTPRRCGADGVRTVASVVHQLGRKDNTRERRIRVDEVHHGGRWRGGSAPAVIRAGDAQARHGPRNSERVKCRERRAPTGVLTRGAALRADVEVRDLRSPTRRGHRVKGCRAGCARREYQSSQPESQYHLEPSQRSGMKQFAHQRDPKPARQASQLFLPQRRAPEARVMA
jgi:hypothetical protein